ncbi:MAG: ABC transporter permease [Christensenellales bacterium]|jgi:NitT/TauT family transport system permease protein
MKNEKQKKTQATYSEEHKKYLKKNKRTKTTTLIIQIGILVLMVVLWEILTHFKLLDPFFYSSPSRIVKKIGDMAKGGSLFVHMGTTLLETVLGFLFSTILGTFIAIVLWWNERTRKVLEPYLIVFNALPKIALGPLIVIWFGTGIKSILFMCILICIVITTMTMLNSFLSCDADKILLLKSMRANKLQIFTYLIFPNSFGELISVLKINVGLSWVGTIMGEYLASKAGLGYLIVYGGQVFDINLVMASTVLLCMLAGVMYFLVSILEKTYKR